MADDQNLLGNLKKNKQKEIPGASWSWVNPLWERLYWVEECHLTISWDTMLSVLMAITATGCLL